jgi:hypothetical protein
MQTTTQVTTPTTIAQKYRITIEQLSSATHVVVGTQHCVIVESSSVPGQEYKIIWNSTHKCLQCTAHNGEACLASTNGKQCYHLRAALALLELERAWVRRGRQAEQAAIEATKEYQFEQIFRDLEDALANLDRIATEADEREQSRRVAESIEAARKWARGGAQIFSGSDVSEMNGFYCGVEA